MRRGVRLGVDVGSVRVGLAVCDPDGMIASPLETLPRALDGRDRAAAESARGYADRLAERVAPVPVRLVDERLSTVGAHRALHDAGVKGRRHRRVVDQVAAVLILQTALDAERASGRVPGSVVDPARAQEEA